MMKRFIVLLAAVMFLVGATSVYAVPELYLQDMNSSVTVIVDDGSALDANPIVGAVTYVGPVGAVWFLNVSTGVTKPVQGSAVQAFMDLSSVNSSTGAGEVAIWFTDTDFLAPSGFFGASLEVGGTIGDSGNAIFGWFLDRNNSQASLSGSTDMLGITQLFGPGAFDFTGSGSASGLTGPFSLALGSNIFHDAKDTSSFDQSLTQVPEPGILILLGMGLSAVGLLSRRIKFSGSDHKNFRNKNPPAR